MLAGVDADPERLAAVRRPGVPLVVVGRAPLDPPWWQVAAGLGADHAVVLPEAQDWLLERLSDVADGRGRRGPVLGVVGGTGGAGASVLAAGLGRALAEVLGGCLLLDADPRSGGLDLLVGAMRCRGCAGGTSPASRGGSGRTSCARPSTSGPGCTSCPPTGAVAVGRTPTPSGRCSTRPGAPSPPPWSTCPAEVCRTWGPSSARATSSSSSPPARPRGAAAACAVLDELRQAGRPGPASSSGTWAPAWTPRTSPTPPGRRWPGPSAPTGTSTPRWNGGRASRGAGAAACGCSPPPWRATGPPRGSTGPAVRRPGGTSTGSSRPSGSGWPATGPLPNRRPSRPRPGPRASSSEPPTCCGCSTASAPNWSGRAGCSRCCRCPARPTCSSTAAARCGWTTVPGCVAPTWASAGRRRSAPWPCAWPPGPGRRLDDASPFVDARLPDGTRLHAVLPPLPPTGPT